MKISITKKVRWATFFLSHVNPVSGFVIANIFANKLQISNEEAKYVETILGISQVYKY